MEIIKRSLSIHAFFLIGITWLLSSVCLASDSSSDTERTLVFAGDQAEYCPFQNCPDGRPGYIPELVERIFQDAGYTVQFTNLPWSRAIQMASSGQTDGIINVVKISAPQLHYPDQHIGEYNGVVLAMAKKNWRFDGVKSLQSLNLGLVQDYGYEDSSPELARYIRNNRDNHERITWISGSKPMERIFTMMMLGRINVTLEEQLVAQNLLRRIGLENEIMVVGNVTPSGVKVYVGFSPAKSTFRNLPKLFDQGLTRLRESGELLKILEKYELKDWLE